MCSRLVATAHTHLNGLLVLLVGVSTQALGDQPLGVANSLMFPHPLPLPPCMQPPPQLWHRHAGSCQCRSCSSLQQYGCSTILTVRWSHIRLASTRTTTHWPL